MIPDERGTYVLVLQSTHVQSIVVGRLGVLDVRPGTYVYIGSAFGSGGLRARVARHASVTKRQYWHIDYLLDVVRLTEIWYAAGTEKQEHLWAKAIARIPGASVPMRGFGSSDCLCEAHLFHFAKRPSARTFECTLGAAVRVARVLQPLSDCRRARCLSQR